MPEVIAVRIFFFPYNFSFSSTLSLSELKELANDDYKFDANGRKYSKRVENTVEKGEIPHYEQFLLIPQCFQKICEENKNLFGKELALSEMKNFRLFQTERVCR